MTVRVSGTSDMTRFRDSKPSWFCFGLRTLSPIPTTYFGLVLVNYCYVVSFLKPSGLELHITYLSFCSRSGVWPWLFCVVGWGSHKATTNMSICTEFSSEGVTEERSTSSLSVCWKSWVPCGSLSSLWVVGSRASWLSAGGCLQFFAPWISRTAHNMAATFKEESASGAEITIWYYIHGSDMLYSVD